MRINVLGCSGAEFPEHRPSGFLLEDEILFDAGTLTSILDERAQKRIRSIIITHAHLDHIKGIPFLADNIIIGRWRRTVNVLSVPPVIRTIKKNLLNSSLWPDFTVIPHHHRPILKLISIKAGIPFDIGGYRVIPYKMNHSVPAAGYLVEDSHRRRLFYTGDTGPSDLTWRKLGGKQIHCLIIEVSFPNRMEQMAIATGHLTPGLLRKELEKIKPSPERIYITHLKPQYLTKIQEELDRLGMKNLSLLRAGEILTV